MWYLKIISFLSPSVMLNDIGITQNPVNQIPTLPTFPIANLSNPVLAKYTPNPFTTAQIAQTPAMMPMGLRQAYAQKMANMGLPMNTLQGTKIGGASK